MTDDEKGQISPLHANVTPAPAIRHSAFVIPLWAWVAAGFLFLATLWTGMFMASRQADLRNVPLAKQGGRP